MTKLNISKGNNFTNTEDMIKAREDITVSSPGSSKGKMTARVSVALTAEERDAYALICKVNGSDVSKDIRMHILQSIKDNAEILDKLGVPMPETIE